MNNKQMNPNLPDNAIAVPKVEVGMAVYAPYAQGVRGRVTGILSVGDRYTFVLHNGMRIRANGAGTLRLS
jgi:hypothetical protein